MADDDIKQHVADRLGGSINRHGGIYVNGMQYGFAKKLHVAAVYESARLSIRFERRAEVNIAAIAKQCQVSRGFVGKIKNELIIHGRVLHPREVTIGRDTPRGIGSRALDGFDKFVLLQLLHDDPTRTLRDYADSLEDYSGKTVSISTISNWFLRAFPIKGSLMNPNLVPYDKFRPENEAKAYEYLFMLTHFAPERVKFGDEKCLKGQELYQRKVRRNPSTGEVAPVITDPDFRNTHSITGFTSIDTRTTPIWFRIHKGTNNAEQFRADVEAAVATGFLGDGDVLVLDNAAYHTGKGNSGLSDWLWNHHGVFLLFLPPRTPEWNPIELVWARLVKRIKKYNLKKLREIVGSNCAAYAANEVLRSITHDEIAKLYEHCYRGMK